MMNSFCWTLPFILVSIQGSGQIKDTGRDTLTFRHMNKRSEITMMKDGLVLRSGTRTRAINKRSELRFNHGYQYLEEHVSKADNITEDGVAILPSRSPDVIAMAGSDIRLSCFVHNIQNKTVSWIRHSDVHILTFGRYAYTQDSRISSIHPAEASVYKLRISSVQKSDAGIYECQVSTSPPIGHYINLTVVEPETEIIGGREMYVDTGSTINLTCITRFSAGRPEYVKWFHFGKEISWEGPRPGVSSIMEAGQTGEVTVSQLLMQKARESDSGNYTCYPHNSKPAYIQIHVLQGKHPAAIQRASAILLSNIILLYVIFIHCSISSIY